MAWDNRLLSRNSKPWSSTKAPDTALEIVEIYAGSMAEQFALRPGLLYLHYQRQIRGGAWKNIAARAERGPLRSEFLDPKSRTLLTLETMGFPWGMRLRPTHHRMTRDLHHIVVPPDELSIQLLNGTDAAYRDLSKAALDGCDRTTLKRWFLRVCASALGKRKNVDLALRPQRAAAAMAAAIDGNAELARHLMPKLDDQLLHGFGKNVGALCHYAEALVAKEEQRSRDEIVKHLRSAIHLAPNSQRIADALTAEGEPTAVIKERTVVRPFPFDYAFPVADAMVMPITPKTLASAETIRLSECLVRLRPDQLGVIILLGGYRTNGFYSAMIENLGHLYSLLGDQLPFVHVVSCLEKIDRPKFVKMWGAGEKHARSRGVPVTVLHDGRDQLGLALSPKGSPTMLLVDCKGRILYEGFQDDDGPFWEAFARLDGIQPTPRP